jgi:hypothetical protein
VMLATAGKVIMYCATCAALIPLRRRQPEANALRIPFGQAVSLLGVAISLALLTQLRGKEIALVLITALVASANWWFARGRTAAVRQVDAAATAETPAP